MLQIPLTAAHDRYVMTVRLDGRDHRLGFAYNAFLSAWHMSIATSGQKPLRSGVRLVNGGVYALSSPAGDKIPSGVLIFMGPDASPQHTFGTDSRLVYVTFDELDQLARATS